MKFGELCTAFPPDPAAWPTARLARALPYHLRARLRALFGGLLASGDIARTRAPAKLGISIRPFQVGDPTSTLARSLLVRTGELYTRTDQAPGRQHACIVVHAYGNMLYRGETAQGNKAQVAISAAAIIAKAHDTLGHAVETVVVMEDSLSDALARLRHRLPRRHHLYLLSDFLFSAEALDATRERLAEAIAELNRAPGALVLVRDPDEWPEGNPLATEQSLLIPLASNESAATAERRFSGPAYVRNLALQREGLSSFCRERQIDLFSAHAGMDVEPFTEALLRRLEGL